MPKIIGEERTYNTQRTCGVWLIYIGAIIIISTFLGGEFLLQPFVLGIGYFVGFIVILVFPFVNNKLAYGKSTKFQDRMDNLSTLLIVLLCTACGMIIGFDDLRVLWLSIFIAVGIHFFGFYFSQGKMMIILGVLTVINGILGLFLLSVPFILFAIIDGSLKLFIGLKMFNMKRPVSVIPENFSS